MKIAWRKISFIIFTLWCAALAANAQNFEREWDFGGRDLEITNNFGRVDVVAEKPKIESESEAGKVPERKLFLTASGDKSISDAEIKITYVKGIMRLEVAPLDGKKRIDLSLRMPAQTRLKIETEAGEVRVSGDFQAVEVETETGTIAADVPLENVKYDFVWTESRPRFLSDVELEEVEEKAAGKFVVNGKIVAGESDTQREKRRKGEKEKKKSENSETAAASDEPPATEDEQSDDKQKDKKPKTKNRKPKTLALNFTTARGIVLLNVNPNEVPSDLRERPLTEAAKAIIRSGDSLLMEAIRRASPKFFGEYAATLPPLKREPELNLIKNNPSAVNSNVKKVLARVTDLNNRAVADLKREDFQVLESGREREILSVEPTTAPFNLVLLLDVSGSVENYVDFIRKAARAFIETASPNDRIAVIIFNEDVKQLSTFTTEKGKLSENLDTFDAGGGTAFYDSIAFVLADTLRPMRGERTAIVALTDGDDNYSFLPFDALLGAIQESGALIYPLYVPSALVAVSNADLNATIDPLRTKYMGLTKKAEGEGERLAQISGGVYYSITQLSQIQKAYNDIVTQLRTAYSVTFRSDLAETTNKTTASPRLKVRVKRENAFVKLGSVVEVPTSVSEVKKN